jgi:hypothetical protein
VKELFLHDPVLWICLILGVLLLLPWNRILGRHEDEDEHR